jgi:hypothetical protein
MTDRAARVGMNEAVFRDVNERIEDLAETFELDEHILDLICECGDAKCMQRITMTQGEYEQVRKVSTHFAVFPGHEEPDVEEIVDRRRGYDIVRKHEGTPAAIAEQTDPRS